MYRVLLVDDEDGYLSLYRQMDAWKDCGFTIAETASHGDDALSKMDKGGVRPRLHRRAYAFYGRYRTA